MITLHDLKDTADAKRFARAALAALLIWLLGFVLLANALYIMNASDARLKETDRILNAATIVKSYPNQSVSVGTEPLTAVSSVVEALGLKDRIGQMTGGSSGLVLQVNQLYPAELTGLLEELAGNGLSVKTAELRAMTAGKNGERRINATIVLEGENQ